MWALPQLLSNTPGMKRPAIASTGQKHERSRGKLKGAQICKGSHLRERLRGPFAEGACHGSLGLQEPQPWQWEAEGPEAQSLWQAAWAL